MTDEEFQFLMLQAQDRLPAQTTFTQVAGWMLDHAPFEKLQAYCLRKGARCEAGHGRLEDCHGVLVTALHMAIDDMKKFDAKVMGDRKKPPGKVLLN